MTYSCTYHPDDEVFHVTYRNYKRIAKGDIANTAMIRFFEIITSSLIVQIRKDLGIPETDVPDDELLWFNEDQVSLRKVEEWTQGVRSKSTLARTLNECNLGRTPPSLIQLGFLQRRYIARYPDHVWPHEVFTEIHQDDRGFFLVVDAEGKYQGTDGGQHAALAEGYISVTKQYLYCFDAVNRAIGALYGKIIEALPRWQNSTPAEEETHRKGFVSTGVIGEHANASRRPKGYFDSAQRDDAFGKQNTTPEGLLSIRTNSDVAGSTMVPRPKLDTPVQHRTAASEKGRQRPANQASLSNFGRTINKNLEGNLKETEGTAKKDSVSLALAQFDFESLRTQPLTADLIIALSSAVLPVPDQATCKPDVWDKEWQRPAELLLIKLQTLDPRLGWERLDVVTRYMVDASSPSWWRNKRARNSPTTLRHVNDHLDDYYREYKKGSWHPAETTRYDGPPLDIPEYSSGYTGVTQALTEPASSPVEEAPEPPVIHEAPEQPTYPAWMSREEAVSLCDAICDKYPELRPELTYVDDRTRWYASVEVLPDAWLHFKCPEDWRLPSPEAVDAIEAARRYAAEQSAIPTEVGVSEATPEPLPIAMAEPPDHAAPPDTDYVSMEDLSAALSRGLRLALPVPSPVVDAVSVVLDAAAPHTEELAPTLAASAKIGMSLFVAEEVLRQIVAAGYRAESVPIRGTDRAYVAVETAPGVWQDFESAPAWTLWLKAARAAPGSIGAVITAAGHRQAMEGQRQ